MRVGLKARPEGDAESASPYPFLGAFFTVQFVILIFFQKFSFPLGGQMELSWTLVALLGGVVVMMMFSRLELSPLRLIAYVVFAASVLFSQAQVTVPFSAPSMLMMLFMYFPMVVVWRVGPDEYKKLLSPFQDFVLIGAIFVFLQLLVQVATNYRFNLNIEPLIPPPLLAHGFFYEGALHFGQPFKRPNGFFFLEASFVSAFLACALATEMAIYKRPLRTLAYGVALLGSMGATGQVMMAAALPILLPQQSARNLVLGAIAAILLGIVATSTGMLDQMFGRVGELNAAGTSGATRISQPLMQLVDVLSDPSKMWTGAGAGNGTEGLIASPWPVVKTSVEYGAFAAITYAVFVTICMWNCPNKALFLALFVMFHVTGGYSLNPVAVNMITLLCCMPSRLKPAKASLTQTLRPVSGIAGSMSRRPASPFAETGVETPAQEPLESGKAVARSS